MRHIKNGLPHKKAKSILKNTKYQISNIYNIGNMIEFKLGDYVYRTNLLGKFNLYRGYIAYEFT